MNIKCKVSISRSSRDVIRIEIQDESSRARFLDLEMTPEAFAFALTGLGHQDASGVVRGLHLVGKTRIDEDRTIVYPGNRDTRAAMEAWLSENGGEPGWIVDSYLGSQGSVTMDAERRTILHYRVSRFVDAAEAD